MKSLGLNKLITKEKLEKMYFDEDLSITEIANIFGCFRTNIEYYLRKYQIKGKALNGSLVGGTPWNKNRSNKNKQEKPSIKRWLNKITFIGEKHPRWKNGGIDGGYIRFSIAKVRQTKHREIMEKYLGRKLNTVEHVHHINGIKTDNRVENLQVLLASEHAKLHSRKYENRTNS